MSNKLNGVDTTLYREILELVPNLNTFLIKNNILFEYVLCLNHYNRANRGVIPFNYSFIETDPRSVISWSFEWKLGNNMLSNNNIQRVSWGALHSNFYNNYYLYNSITFKHIKII